jgi:hypothetical protein
LTTRRSGSSTRSSGKTVVTVVPMPGLLAVQQHELARQRQAEAGAAAVADHGIADLLVGDIVQTWAPWVALR